MKVVGSRQETSAIEDQAALARTATALRGTPHLVPRGVYRFSSFEEADAWMTQMLLRSRAPRNPPTSSASAAR
jgi:hypothetical protein